MAFSEALPTFATPVVRLHLNEQDGTFLIYSRERKPDARWSMNAKGTLLQTSAPPRHRHIDWNGLKARCPNTFDAEAFYNRARRLGLQYGASFRCIREGWIGKGEALLRLRLGSVDAASAEEYYVHPAILDGALQSGLALQINSDPTGQTVSLPVGIEQLRFHRKAGASVWCYTVLSDSGAELVLFDDEGIALVEVFGLRTRPVTLDEGEWRKQNELLYTNQWQHQRAEQLDLPQATTWLVFADEGGVADQLRDRAAEKHMTHVLVKPGSRYEKRSQDRFEITRGSREDLARLLEEIQVDHLAGVVYLWPFDIPETLEGADSLVTGRDDVVDLLHLVQLLADVENSTPPPITLCSVGTQIVVRGDRGREAPGQNALWSAARSAQLELPHLRFKLVDLATNNPFIASKHLLAELQASADETEVAFRGNSRYVNRIVRLGPERYPAHVSTPNMRYELASVEKGGFRRRGFVEVEPRVPKSDEVEVAIHWSALGDNDRLSLQQHNPQTMPTLNVQCTGRITAVGDGVETLWPGQDVIVLEPQEKLASHIVIADALVLPYPEGLSLRDGGAAFDWLAAYYALFEAGGLQAGQWVLVHQADSGIGLAAMQLGHWAGAKVIATCGTEKRRSHVRSLDCGLVSDSRSLAFCDDVRAATGG